MPKRGNRRRGSSRGGGASKGRIPTNKKLRGNKRHPPKESTSYNELMDLEENIYIPPTNSLASAARNIGRRKYGHGSLIEEIQYTDSHHGELMSRKLRNRPVDFVLAKEIYDPNVLLHKLAKKDIENDQVNVHEIIDDEFRSINLEDSDEVEEELIDELGEELEEEENSEEEEEGSEIDSEKEFETDFADKFSNRKLSDEITHDREEEPIFDDEDASDTSNYTQSYGKYGSDDDDNLQQGVTLYDYEGESDEEEIEKILDSELANLESRMNGITKEDEQELDEVLNESSDTDDSKLDLIIDTPSQKVEYSHKSSPLTKLKDSPEYGYLEEDYEFDTSRIEVSNVRFGINNQYHLKSIDLVGIPDTFAWIDEEEVIEFVLNNGVKQNRLEKFLSFITRGMIDKRQESSDEESEVYISDDSEVDDYPYDSDDNINDLIEYSKNSTQQLVDYTDRDLFSNNVAFENRSNYDDIDDELEESLKRQLRQFQHDRKKKRQFKEQQKIEEAVERSDMLIKYPISLHIKDIKKEFDLLLKDEQRQSMSFPTLDTHAHKTIKKMADCYHMSVHKCGAQGIRKYLKIVKIKATFKYRPIYQNIDKILRGRPIFHRIDKKPDPKNGKTKDFTSKSNQAKFKEGDIVGAEAPELDSNNLGRQMLEKLGWTKGQGLGTDNRGINEPILAKMKTSKVGIK